MTSRTDDIVARCERATESVRFGLAEWMEIEPHMPAEIARLVGATIATIRSWRPESVSPLGALGPPTEIIRDPRGEAGPR